ncbi:hypothetical protein N7508_008108 [Penicillium antarcticum]|uniref:uncharacterized protein n=1 Tax=Penicillium antarcticum TaxID=416450 RepID=UPI0023A6D174|nr:uncharacterized protein N7508_008108 [Penicillium antarcticum]KAJ5297859.1 hypothetical protein N7508_008108 [Penicillium antarcticum]
MALIKDSITTISSLSKFLFLSYVLDWIFIIGIALIGYGFYKQHPNRHPFSLSDPTISYPQSPETVTTETLLLVSLLAPALLVFLISALVVPGSAAITSNQHAKPSAAHIIRRKIWEWNAGWMGLALALASAWCATQGLKVLIGKPRPDLIARCDPDLSAIDRYTVGGLGGRVDGAPVLVSWEICRDQSNSLSIDGFASFPSGHSSFSFSGLLYLTLWLCSKFSVGFPYLPHYPVEDQTFADDASSVRRRGAAPPVYLMLIAFFPTATAAFISGSRWFNYRHHGFDILFGSALGIFFAYIGFSMYQLPIRRGAGWAWGARSRRRAFMRGLGFPSSLGTDSWSYTHNKDRETHANGHSNGLGTDIEMAPRGRDAPLEGHAKPGSSSGNGARLEE